MSKLSYSQYVELGRAMLKQVRCYQVQIAFYANEVCQIRHGGKEKGLYTLSMYSKDIGINRKTLSKWVGIYRCVIEKLDVDLNEVSVQDWVVANRVYDLLRNEKQAINAALGKEKAKDKGWKIQTPAGKIKDMFRKYQNERPVEAEVHGWTDTVTGIKNKISTKDLSSVSTESLLMLKNRLDQASTNLTDYLLDHRELTIGELI